MLNDHGGQAKIIESAPHARCELCGGDSTLLYENLTDRLYGAPGHWRIVRCRNPKCRSAWLDPMPTPATVAFAYTDYYTHGDEIEDAVTPPRLYATGLDRHRAAKYGCPRIAHNTFRKELLAEIWRWLDPGLRAEAAFSTVFTAPRPRGRTLDVGCGAGELMVRMRQMGWEIEGIDVDPAAVARARQCHLNVSVATVAQHAEMATPYDLITLSHVIEHVHDPILDLGHCRGMLNPGGRVVIVTPNLDSMQHSKFGRAWLALDPPRHLHLFNIRSLTLAARAAGFRKIQSFTTVRKSDRIWLASRNIKKSGRHERGQTAGTARLMLTKCLQTLLWLRLLCRCAEGDELVLIADVDG